MGLREMFGARDLPQAFEGDRKKPNMVIIWIIIIGIVFLAFGGFSPKTENKASDREDINTNLDGYEEEQEERLEQILKKINGAGDVSVFINLEGGGEKILARDDKSKVSQEAEGYSEERESQIVMVGKSTDGKPYVTEEKAPSVGGILVVAEGASNEKVRIEIYEAVAAVYGVPAHRIRVTY